MLPPIHLSRRYNPVRGREYLSLTWSRIGPGGSPAPAESRTVLPPSWTCPVLHIKYRQDELKHGGMDKGKTSENPMTLSFEASIKENVIIHLS